jgi:pseudouridine-5'-phosphate glycosidase
MSRSSVVLSDEVAQAVQDNRPVVALESTLITHGLPKPLNWETATEAEAAVRAQGAIPATIAVWNGVPTVGLTPMQLRELSDSAQVWKASRRDLGAAIGLKHHAGTTVSATMVLAQLAGLSVFATGGIGGAHRPPAHPADVSADLHELARTPILVVCAGAKSILDLPRTLEILETLGVPVVGYRTSTFPEFTTAGGDLPVSARVETAAEAAAVFAAHRAITGTGMLLVNPLPEDQAVPSELYDWALQLAEVEAVEKMITGAQLTPFLLERLAMLTEGQTLKANRQLIVNNARLAAEVAVELQAISVGR